MTIVKICSVSECDASSDYKNGGKKGLCQKHYARLLRTGSETGRRKIANGEATAFFHEVVMKYEGEECLVWPFARSSFGYGVLVVDGKKCRVSRLVCEAMNGPSPGERFEAAHNCGNGHIGCVAKTHMSWKTRSENQMDRVEHGTSNRGRRHGMVKLTEIQVREIRSLKGKMLQREIGKMFSINQAHVSDIMRGHIWGWLS